MESLNKDDLHKYIAEHVIKSYEEKIIECIQSQPKGSLTEPEVIVMIMNTIISVSTYIYFSFSQFLPNSALDYEYLRRKLINQLSDSFDNVKNICLEEKENGKDENISESA